jgi:protein-S-isoprenylcysteine O-methyltransferase Ste14
MQQRSVIILGAFQIVAMMAVLWLLMTFRGPWNIRRYVGTALVVAGISGIIAARYYLGRSFAIRPEAKKLVTGGIYSKIRNPIYVSGLVMLLGLILILQYPGPVPWVILAAVAVGQTIRARREARVLEAAFGDDYREYRRKTWF